MKDFFAAKFGIVFFILSVWYPLTGHPIEKRVNFTYATPKDIIGLVVAILNHVV